jgi:hypothetical protein
MVRVGATKSRELANVFLPALNKGAHPRLAKLKGTDASTQATAPE